MTLIIRSPKPSGKFAVGVTTHSLSDTSRIDIFSKEPSHTREMPLQIWYPAEVSDSDQVLVGKAAMPWGGLICPPKDMPVTHYEEFFDTIINTLQAFIEQAGMSNIIPKHIGRIESHAYPHAPLSQAQSSYPVVVYSHGFGGNVAQMDYLFQELASHGYIVVAIGHTYTASLTIFSNERMIPYANENAIIQNCSEEYTREQSLLNDIKQHEAIEYKRKRMAELYIEGEITDIIPSYRQLIVERRKDIQFTVDELYRLNNDATWFFGNVLDLDRLAGLGYSLGGEGLSEALVDEQRIKVGFAIDSMPWGYLLGRTVKQAFFTIYAEKGMREELLDIDSPAIVINNTRHGSFSNTAFWNEWLGKTELIGSLPTSRCHEITSRFVLAFLNRHLYGIEDSILQSDSGNYPEVTFLT